MDVANTTDAGVYNVEFSQTNNDTLTGGKTADTIIRTETHYDE